MPDDPRDSVVVLVGVDSYAAGPAWQLAGPVDDAVRLARWYLDRGVPAEQMYLLASPLDAVPDDLPVRHRFGASHADVRDVFLRQLPTRPQRRLHVLWGGHGYLDTFQHRRVHYADATVADPVDLDLDSLLAMYATDLVPFEQQLWVVDACLTHERATRLPRQRGHEEFPRGAAVPGRAIDALFGAGFGEPAVNLDAVRAGLFSRELLAVLGAGWPPEPARLIDELRHRLGELRALGETRQTPTYVWYRTAAGDEGQLLQRPDPGRYRSDGTGSGSGDLAALGRLVDALLDIEEFRRPGGREEIMSLLRREMSAAVPRQTAARLDAVAIVRTCRRFPGGLAELAEAVRFVAPADPGAGRLAELVAQVA